ncbi:hypothetical protein T484DRAFT_2896690 [Baffinella frigidus]|nr:hypothetical protein T484DRAFT_2896690 [Cryptophyta sp. CCMP2293]
MMQAGAATRALGVGNEGAAGGLGGGRGGEPHTWGGADVWESPAAARQAPDLQDADSDDFEFLDEARKEAILAGIARVASILDSTGLDSMKTDTIGQMLRTGTLDLCIIECFLGDGQWDPDRCRFEGAPDWGCVRRALEVLREAVLEEHLTVHSHSPRGRSAPVVKKHLRRPAHPPRSASPSCIHASPQHCTAFLCRIARRSPVYSSQQTAHS